MFIIYRAALTLLHVTWTLIIFFKRIWADLRTRCDTVLKIFNLRKRISSPETELLVRSVRRINKDRLPRHLVLVLGRERASFQDIVRIIAWCATAGIPYISFYDHDGLLRKNESEARRELAKSKPEMLEYINWNSTCPVKPVRNGVNGVKHKVQVQLLSYTDGKREIALLAQSLGKGVITGALRVEEVVPELLKNKLELNGLPDPDLAIVCGKTCSTYGLLPWHIRTTEFLLLDSHRDLHVNKFISLLEKYAKCEQRYGK